MGLLSAIQSAAKQLRLLRETDSRKDDVAQKPATVHSQSAAERARQPEQAKARFCQGMVREAAKAAEPGSRSLVRPPCCRGQLHINYGAASTAAAVLPPVSDPPPAYATL